MAKEKVPSFEQSLKELESIVAELEKAEGPLEEQLKAFEKGVGISRQVLKHLDEVEKRVEVLLNKEGLETAPFKEGTEPLPQ
jgi:exodeoxyribonuclease VII small subunit